MSVITPIFFLPDASYEIYNDKKYVLASNYSPWRMILC